MRELSEKELALVSGGGQSSAADEEVLDPTMPDIGVESANEGTFDPLGTNGGYKGPTWTNPNGTVSVTVGVGGTPTAPSAGVGVTITLPTIP